LPPVRNHFLPENLSAKGAYEVAPAEGASAKVTIFASGSEVAIALGAQSILAQSGVAARVVSVPCLDLFLKQDHSKRQEIIGDAPIRVAVEAAVRQGWDAIIGEDGIFIGMSGFGASAPYKDLYNHFKITPEAVAEAAQKRCGN
jgi:transketolase